ncbi:hypothetical protein [Klebsiella phage vB_KshKPC-M]|nr:hypothetical protein [Klebsiella phage vB_KshKPC-M]
MPHKSYTRSRPTTSPKTTTRCKPPLFVPGSAGRLVMPRANHLCVNHSHESRNLKSRLRSWLVNFRRLSPRSRRFGKSCAPNLAMTLKITREFCARWPTLSQSSSNSTNHKH